MCWYIKEKIASIWALTYGAKYFIEEFKEASTHLSPTKPTTRLFFTAKDQIKDSCKRYRNHVKNSSVYNLKNKIETKDLPQLDRPFSIKKSLNSINELTMQVQPHIFPLKLPPLRGGIESFCSNRIFSAKVLPRCLTRVTENCKHSKVRKNRSLI